MSIRAVTLRPIGHYTFGRSQNVVWLRQIFTPGRNLFIAMTAATTWLLATSEWGRPAVENVIYLIQNI